MLQKNPHIVYLAFQPFLALKKIQYFYPVEVPYLKDVVYHYGMMLFVSLLIIPKLVLLPELFKNRSKVFAYIYVFELRLHSFKNWVA